MKKETKIERIIEYFKNQRKWKDSIEISRETGISRHGVLLALNSMNYNKKYSKILKKIEKRMNRNMARYEFRLKK